jgi:hypothetical protein
MFTDEELEQAVLNYLTSDAVATRTPAGSRDIVAAKTQVFEIISAAFMLRPAALFAVCWLASNGLRAKVAQQLADLYTILEAAPRVSQSSQKVQSVTDLRNAEASLLTLTAAFSTRTRGVAGNIGPAVQRFNASIERFMRGELAKNTVRDGDIVKTPEELRVVVAEAWKTASERHVEIVDAVGYLASALSTYAGVRLPDSVVGSLLTRIQARLAELTVQMEAITAPRDSRSALLELSAMRTLLAQAARFRPPELKKAPLTGDGTTGVLTGGSGTPASVLGTVSAPYNYAYGTELAYSVAGVPGVISLPGSSAGVLYSVELNPWADPPVGSTCAVTGPDDTEAFAAAAWGSGPAAAAAMDAAIDFATVSWNSVTHRLEIVGDTLGDNAVLFFDTSSSARAAFASWFVGSTGLAYSAGSSVAMEDVLRAFASAPKLKASAVRQQYESFTGQRSDVANDVVWHRVASGSDLMADGSNTVRAGVDLEALGVVPGMVLSAAGIHRIAAVSGATLVLESTLVGGPLPYFIGPDYTDLGVGARVVLSGTADAGNYRVVQGSYAQVQLDRVLSSGAAAQVSMSREQLLLTVRDVGPAATLAITAGAGATALGLMPQTAPSWLDTFETRTDLGARGVEPGDLITLFNTASGELSLSCRSVSGTQVQLSAPIPYEATELRYLIRCAPVQDYVDLRTDLRVVQGDTTFTDLRTLDQAMARLIRGARFVGDVAATLNGYVAALLELLDICDAYEVQRDPTVEQAVRVMQEHGFDRAADLFLALRLDEFFALDADGVSYKTWLYQTIRTVVPQIAPTTKDTRDTTGGFRTVSIQPAGTE